MVRPVFLLRNSFGPGPTRRPRHPQQQLGQLFSPRRRQHQVCSGLEKSPFGAKSDFEIWAFKVFLFFGPEKSSKEGLEVATPENLKWKKYIRRSENAVEGPLKPLWGWKKLKFSTKRTLRPTNLPFWFGEKSSWCRFEKRRKVQKVLHFWSGEKSWWCSF